MVAVDTACSHVAMSDGGHGELAAELHKILLTEAVGRSKRRQGLAKSRPEYRKAAGTAETHTHHSGLGWWWGAVAGMRWWCVEVAMAFGHKAGG